MSYHLKLVSECYVRPHCEVDESKTIHHLNPFELEWLSIDNAHIGFLFSKPSIFSTSSFMEGLRISLSKALVYFYPLAGRFETVRNEAKHSCIIYIDCRKGLGARLIHASAQDVTMLDVLNPDADVPKVVLSFFDLGEIAINYDGHTSPLLSIQVTELRDGIFVGICYNHVVIDGTSIFNFHQVWSHIFMGTLSPPITLPLIKSPEFLDGRTVKLPYLDSSEFIDRFSTGTQFRDRVFQFSTQSLKKLKSMANSELSNDKMVVSSFQALLAFVWKCITRVRNLPQDELTTCAIAVNLKPRFNMTDDHFGCYTVKSKVPLKVSDLLNNSIGWAAMLLHQGLTSLDNRATKALVLQALDEGPKILPPTQTLSSNNIIVAGSPRFNYNVFNLGLGRLVACRGGYGNKADGKVTAFSGLEGDGSVNLEICLAPHTMKVLVSDQEFMCFASQQDGHSNLTSRI